MNPLFYIKKDLLSDATKAVEKALKLSEENMYKWFFSILTGLAFALAIFVAKVANFFIIILTFLFNTFNNSLFSRQI